MQESSVLSELQDLREQLERSEEERKTLERQLSEANSSVTQLQEEGIAPRKQSTRLNGACRKMGQKLNAAEA